MNLLSFVVLLCIFGWGMGAGLEQVDDSDLVHLLTGDDNVIVLFTQTRCEDCNKWELLVENIYNELTQSLGAIVVKAHNSQLVGIYDPSKEPSLVFFRRGIPLLYHGDLVEDDVVRLFSDNREPVVKELADENFEHLTQAATGATTGDWFVFFYSADCIFCQRLYAVWETVGAVLRHRLNVARVNRLEAGISTAKRFGITTSPEFIFLRQGKLYRYKLKEYTPKSFIEFAQSGFAKQSHPEPVPAEISYMSDMLSNPLELLTENKNAVIIVSASVGLLVLIVLIKKCFTTKPKSPSPKSKKAK
ncbi:thioredoxin domain-containing protein [Teleopsis dalmanni]|uniref:thioredoxin domain-containing protein n=1 Tax=Teleopsis dalmanni TaxID=139649 RepID=UPI0018CD25AA|nr:thioredoxin domain-containing protein [Teleopsis dalmanni]